MSIVIPNMCGHLKLFEITPNERRDRVDATRTLDIVAWLPSDKGNRLVPITVCGVPPMVPGAHYAILSEADKSYTTLDGQRFAEYRDWSRTWDQPEKPADRPADAVSEASPTPSLPVSSNTPKPWFTPERREHDPRR